MPRHYRIRRTFPKEKPVRPLISVESWVKMNSFAHLHSVDLSTTLLIAADIFDSMDETTLNRYVEKYLPSDDKKPVSRKTV